MRHSDYRTTLKHYTVLGLTDTARGMDQVPSIGKSKRNMATGTCKNNPQQYLQQSQHDRGRNHANRRDKPATGTDGNANTQSSVSADKCATTRDGATLSDPPAGVAQLVERQLPKLRTSFATSVKSSISDNATSTSSDSPSSQAQNTSHSDTDLVALINAWATLPDEAKTTILMIMKASRNA